MPPIRPAPDANPTPEVRHSVGKTCADTMYRPDLQRVNAKARGGDGCEVDSHVSL